jgi:acetone carboxylase gamma subunit
MKDGRIVTYCRGCGFIYGDSDDNFKYYCLIYEKNPLEVFPGPDSDDRMAPDKDWCILREFYCPGCGAKIELESTPPGTPVLRNYSFSKEE